MSFRRFLYLVSDVEAIDGSCSLRRIDTSRFFFRTSTPPTEGAPVPLVSGGGGGTDPSAAHDGGRLPDPAIKLCPPFFPHSMDVGGLGFVLFKNKAAMGSGRQDHEHEHDKVVGIDRTGCSFMFDPATAAAADNKSTITVRALPSLTSPKYWPFVSLTVGESLYVMDSNPGRNIGGRRHSFEVLEHADHPTFKYIKNWCWRPLDPPPLVLHPDRKCHIIDSYTVDADAGGILVSNNASNLTYRFDTESRAWSKAGDWVLPFNNLAEYLPDHRLWFGIAQDGDHFCAAAAAYPELSSSSFVVRGVWKEYGELRPEWSPAMCYAVYLGSSKFCIVRFYYTGKVYVCPESNHSWKREEDLHVVITGVEVQGGGDGDVQVVRHKSERYSKIDIRLYYELL